MDPNMPLLIVSTVMSSVVLLGGLAMVLVYRVKMSARPKDVDRLEAQIRTLQESIDTIAVEMERVAESQRFTAKLVADRRPDALPVRSPERVITPH